MHESPKCPTCDNLFFYLPRLFDAPPFHNPGRASVSTTTIHCTIPFGQLSTSIHSHCPWMSTSTPGSQWQDLPVTSDQCSQKPKELSNGWGIQPPKNGIWVLSLLTPDTFIFILSKDTETQNLTLYKHNCCLHLAFSRAPYDSKSWTIATLFSKTAMSRRVNSSELVLQIRNMQANNKKWLQQWTFDKHFTNFLIMVKGTAY